MNIEFIQRNKKEIDSAAVALIAEKAGLHNKLAELLYLRGFETPESVKKFLNPSIENLHDPLLLAGMKDAIERINQAIENDEKVVVYGDYDADGICAAAILSLYLSSRGLNIYTHIPNRVTDGYGLSFESLERIIENTCPDLIITCDCGISAVEEVEFATDLGVDVIVTDHHEVSDTLPKCIIVNPKRVDCNYPIDYLSGAGVALKVVEALGGRNAAEEYFDLAAVATIADLVPLLDENRLIVQLGLSNIKNKGLMNLIKNQQIDNSVTSSDIAYKIAPRINAAGRMGDAYRAFELLITKDIAKISEIIAGINEDNQNRKMLCDKIYLEAIEDIQSENLVDNRAIILSHPSWEKGVTGILAARIAGDFKRPAFILVGTGTGDQYKGTCRSINNINIYELLSAVSDTLTEFGGHNQAAGFSIKKENIPIFKTRVYEYLKKYDDSYFLPTCEYDIEINLNEIDLALCKSLEQIEPVGNSNLRPVFVTEVDKLNVSVFKNNPNHTNIITQNNLSIIAFNNYNENQFLLGENTKKLALELSVNTFGSKISPKAVLRAVKPSSLYINELSAKSSYLKQLEFLPEFKNKSCNFSNINFAELSNLLNGSIYGTLIIAGCSKTYDKISREYSNNFFINEFIYNTTINNYSKIIISPLLENMQLSNYTNIIFADSPLNNAVISYINSKTKAKVLLLDNDNKIDFLRDVDLSRDVFIKYFDAIRKNTDITALNIFTYFKLLSSRIQGLELQQFIACYLVFNELELISLQPDEFSLKINIGTKNDLTNSSIYQYIKQIQAGI